MRFEILSNTVGLWYHVVCLECNSVSEDPSASNTRVNNHLLQWWSQQNPLKCRYTSPTLLLHYTMLRDPSASITRVNNHLPQWWSQQNLLKCQYTSTTLLHYMMLHVWRQVFIHMHARVRNQKYVSIYEAVFRIVLSATLREMKLLSCFTRSRDQMMWSWSACIWAAASAADSGYITVVHPNPVHR